MFFFKCISFTEALFVAETGESFVLVIILFSNLRLKRVIKNELVFFIGFVLNINIIFFWNTNHYDQRSNIKKFWLTGLNFFSVIAFFWWKKLCVCAVWFFVFFFCFFFFLVWLVDHQLRMYLSSDQRTIYRS